MLLICNKLQTLYFWPAEEHHGDAITVAILTNRGSDRAFRGSISKDLLNRWSAKSFSVMSSIGLRFSKNFCTTKIQRTRCELLRLAGGDEVSSVSDWPWCRSPPWDSTVGSGTAGSLPWSRPLSFSYWSWSDLCHVCARSLGFPLPSSGCWLGRYLFNTCLSLYELTGFTLWPSSLTLYKQTTVLAHTKEGNTGGVDRTQFG